MSKCICNSCKNLKSIIDENNLDKNGITETCEFGFPSDDCLDCQLEGCELTCDNYAANLTEEKLIITKCARCGKEMAVQSQSPKDGEVYCVACYLND